MIQLKRKLISEKLFNDILTNYSTDCEYVGDKIYTYFFGFKDKYKIYYNEEYIVANEVWIEPKAARNTWIQSVYRISKETVENNIVDIDVSGTYATNYMNKILRKFYSKDEIEEILKQHEAEYDDNKIQLHYLPYTSKDAITCFSNCYEYDINGAYHSELIRLFPKAEHSLTKLYINRKLNSNYKKFVNYYIGNLCNTGHRNTFNYIVQHIRCFIEKIIEYLHGNLIYANTDGFIIQSPCRFLENSKALGECKLEYKGNVFYFQADNYYVIKTNKIRGSISTLVRDLIDLEHNIVVSYERKKDINTGRFTIENILKKEVKIIYA